MKPHHMHDIRFRKWPVVPAVGSTFALLNLIFCCHCLLALGPNFVLFYLYVHYALLNNETSTAPLISSASGGYTD